MRTLLGSVLVLVMGAPGCHPTKLDQCREAVKETLALDCEEGFPNWARTDRASDWDCDLFVLGCLQGQTIIR